MTTRPCRNMTPRPARRLLAMLTAVLAAATLAACGDDGEPSTARAAGSSGSTPQDAPEGRGVVTVNDDGTRTVRSTWGTVTVPKTPTRVVSVLGYIDFESMLALGVKPLAAGTQGGTARSGFAPHLEGRTDGIEPLAWNDGAPAEAIAKLRPDLIFAPDEDSAKLLADIAPTVPGGAANGTEWKKDFRYIAAVLGMEDEADRLLAEYGEEASRLRGALDSVVDGRTVASAQVAYDHTQVYVDRPDAFSSAILTELGLTLSPLVGKASGDEPITISLERLADIDADILFWQIRQRDEDGHRDIAGLDVAKRSPLWQQIPAVAAGAIHEVDNRPWYFPTILAAHRVLDDIEAALLT